MAVAPTKQIAANNYVRTDTRGMARALPDVDWMFIRYLRSGPHS